MPANPPAAALEPTSRNGGTTALSFFQWMGAPAGRILRTLLGSILVVVGALGVDGWGWVVVVCLGCVQMATAGAGISLIAPLFGQPLRPEEDWRDPGGARWFGRPPVPTRSRQIPSGLEWNRPAWDRNPSC